MGTGPRTGETHSTEEMGEQSGRIRRSNPGAPERHLPTGGGTPVDPGRLEGDREGKIQRHPSVARTERPTRFTHARGLHLATF